ncbi:MAG TPA: hypothetical protein VK814_10015 [Acidobacteriaceae bacterium]|nr:hypothetical protein [Acidobacteriaceae bacterium]
MRPRRPISHRAARVRSRCPRSFSLLLLLIAACAAIPLHAQDVPPPEPDGSTPYTLHLYARLVELPTFIFIRADKPPALDAKQIDIKLTSIKPNSTQLFHPVSFRLQGNDPLSIAILVDVSGDQINLLSAIQKDLSPWVAHSLRPRDHVSIFALDCNIIQTSNDVPANPSLLQTGLDFALASPLSHGDSTKPSCGKSIRLSGSILFVMRKLSQLPGRRILLVVSSGREGKTNLTWPELGTEAGVDSVTVFALTTHGPLESQGTRDLYTFTRQSGGLFFTLAPADLPKALDRLVSLLRSRYILQFPMPHDKTPVAYRVVVTVPKFEAVTLPSGISVPLPDPSLDQPSTDLPSAAPPPDSNPHAPDPPPAAPTPPAPNN